MFSPLWFSRRESAERLSLLFAAPARGGGRVKSAAGRRTAIGGLLLTRLPRRATSAGRARISVRRTRSQLRDGAVQGGLGALPPTSEMGIAASAVSPFWPVCINTGIACRFPGFSDSPIFVLWPLCLRYSSNRTIMYLLEVHYGIYDFERSRQEMGRVPSSSELLLCWWPYSRRCEDVDNLVNTERCGKAEG